MTEHTIRLADNDAAAESKVDAIADAVRAKSEFLSIDDLMANDDKVYKEVDVPAWGKLVFGSLTAAEMMDWAESNKGEAKKTGGVRLIVRSIVHPETKQHVPADKVEAYVEKMRNKNAKSVDVAIEHIMELNGLKISPEALKNASSEAVTDASPTLLR